MSAADLEQVKDALVDAKGNPVSDVNDAVGFDLSHSKTWISTHGLPKRGLFLDSATFRNPRICQSNS